MSNNDDGRAAEVAAAARRRRMVAQVREQGQAQIVAWAVEDAGGEPLGVTQLEFGAVWEDDVDCHAADN